MTWLVPFVVLAQTPDFDPGLMWEQGVSSLRRERGYSPEDAARHFRAAAAEYALIRQTPGQETANLDRWLGHSYLGAGDLPHAIAAYRRGLTLDPADAKLRAALGYARGQVEYPPSPELAAAMRPETEVWPPWLALRR